MRHYDLRTNLNVSSIVSSAQGDVNGDGVLDYVFLTGIKVPDSPYIQNITLLIQNGRTGMLTTIPLQENAGYNPTLFLGDFTGDGVEDILISINSGGSGAIMYHYIYSFAQNIPQLIFDFNNYNEQFQYDVTFLDQFKVEVNSILNNVSYIIDISQKGEEYLNEIYGPNGKLISPISGFVNPLSGLYPVDFDSNNVFELLAYQKIAGRYNADSLGYVLNTLSWKDNMFVLQMQYVAVWGSQN